MSPGRALRNRPFLRFLTLGVLVVFVPFCVGCQQWRPVSVSRGSTETTEAGALDPQADVRPMPPDDLVGKRVRIYNAYGVVEMYVDEVQHPWAIGHPPGPSKSWRIKEDSPLRIDLSQASRIEIQELDGTRTTVAVVLVFAAVITVAVLLTDATSGSSNPQPQPSTGGGGSCPVVYMQDQEGLRPVGVLYAGAIYRSLQRQDLLPLPTAAAQRLVLSNERPETQYTDLVELLLIDHEPGTRAVATHGQEPILVGDTTPTSIVVDLSGNDVTGAMASTDGIRWRTDLRAVAQSSNEPPHREGLIATFPAAAVQTPVQTRAQAPTVPAQPVLEITLANTDWLETAVERFMALTGDQYADYLARANAPLSGPLLRHWCEREGLHLQVEWRHGDTWEHVAFVPPVGPTEPRRVAVPLPLEAADRLAPLSVRLSGGIGFWEIDEISLSQQVESDAHTSRRTPLRALADSGRDERDALAGIDGRYQVLADIGDRVELAFDLPAPPLDRLRSAFVFSSGYYNLHPPVARTDAIAGFDAIVAEPGGFAAFSMELYRAYLQAATTLQQQDGMVLGSE